MVNTFRRFQQPLLIALTVFVIIAFVILYGGPGARLDKLGSDKIATIYDRSVLPHEYRNIGRQFEICRRLGMFDLIIPLSQNARTMGAVTENYVWNTVVLRHMADKLGIQPTEAQIADVIRHLQGFQTQNQYDHSKYLAFVQGELMPRGMNSSHLEDIAADSLRLQAIRDMLAANSAPSPDEIQSAFERRFQKIEAAVVRISKSEIAKTVTVSDADIQTAFEARKDTLKTPEKRSVQFAFFPLPAKGPDTAPNAEAMQKVADTADDFAAALLTQGAKLEDVAAKFGVELKSTAAFARGERIEAFSNQPRVSAAAFQLTQEKPVSDTVGTEKGYYVLHLLSVEEARPLPLEEAKPKLLESLKADRVRETLSLKAADVRKQIEAAVQAGKTFVEAAQTAGFKAEVLDVFSRADTQGKSPDATLIQNTASELKAGQTSSPVEGEADTLLVHVAKRLPIDPAELEKEKPNIIPMLESQRTDGLLSEWVERQRNAAGLEIVQP
jgi:peptidyl-prolyl cis-trans isomerase D